MRVGNGEKVRIFEDRWVEGADLLTNNTNSSIEFVSELINQQEGKWDMALLREMFNYEMVGKILALPLPRHTLEDR